MRGVVVRKVSALADVPVSEANCGLLLIGSRVFIAKGAYKSFPQNHTPHFSQFYLMLSVSPVFADLSFVRLFLMFLLLMFFLGFKSAPLIIVIQGYVPPPIRSTRLTQKLNVIGFGKTSITQSKSKKQGMEERREKLRKEKGKWNKRRLS
jgi:hypothetical protein